IEICFGNNVYWELNENYTYQWSNGATSNSLTISPEEFVYLTVDFSDENGCSNSVDVSIEVDGEPFQISVDITTPYSCPYIHDVSVQVIDFPNELYTYELYERNFSILLEQNSSGI